MVHNEDALAFDYRALTENHLMQDVIGDIPIVVTLEQDTVSFHALNTRMATMDLSFVYNPNSGNMMDLQTESIWNLRGTCISGIYEGQQLHEVQSYVEYWHSWERFHHEGRKANSD